MSVLPPDKRPIVYDSSHPQRNLSLQTSKTSKRVHQIDRIRANGVSDHIALPQLVVYGDHSAGKSSVLEGISGIPFPRQDGLCTRFATEIILRHEPTRTVKLQLVFISNTMKILKTSVIFGGIAYL
ncbi:Dynamin [Penicillium samsonianum]|uniref:Dynamin n=1 Tax=Penicillium samsonianum TaxID=1882272 RepID=UPI0025487871|nr:Dynamin [Penicillium samsonianum]KAJ6139503.1 Dynamin [Penicillium samsonianum]